MIESEKMEEISSHIKETIHINYELVKLQAFEKLAGIGAGFLGTLVLAVLAFLSVIFLSFWVANCLSEFLNWNHIGLAIVGAFYLVVYLFLLLLKSKCLINPVRNKFIRMLTQKG